MTQREYERLRSQSVRYGYHQNKRLDSRYPKSSSQDKPDDGYLAFFKLRCLICFVLFLGLVAVDRRIDAKDHESVQQVVKYLNEETIPVNAIIPVRHKD